jgi:hypothetical protein
VCPVIDYIDAETMRYNTGAAGGIGTFWWSLHYKMDGIPQRERKRRKNPSVDPLRVCFAIQVKFYKQLRHQQWPEGCSQQIGSTFSS